MFMLHRITVSKSSPSAMFSEKCKQTYQALPSAMHRSQGKSQTLWTALLLSTSFIVTLIASTFSFVKIEADLKHFDISKPPPRETCDTPMARPSWHELPPHRRHAFTRAVQRLASRPSRLGLSTSLYDDFVYVHLQIVWQVHHTAISLPFHRYFVHVFEQTLIKEGGFDYLMPYWDWTLDAEDPLASPVWDARLGFGGNGSTTGCVNDGIFARIGKSANYTESGYRPHCMQRLFEDDVGNGTMQSGNWNKDTVASVVSQADTYDVFREGLEDGPHRQLHIGIGGEMPTSASPNDPVLFLIHAQIDRLWWLWQQKDPQQRSMEYFGPAQVSDDLRLDRGAVLEDQIKMLGLAADVKVRDVMTTNNDLLCYKYKNEL